MKNGINLSNSAKTISPYLLSFSYFPSEESLLVIKIWLYHWTDLKNQQHRSISVYNAKDSLIAVTILFNEWEWAKKQ